VSGYHYHNIYVTHVTKLEDERTLHKRGFVCVEPTHEKSRYEEIWKLCKTQLEEQDELSAYFYRRGTIL
jgi:hypothetical protein